MNQTIERIQTAIGHQKVETAVHYSDACEVLNPDEKKELLAKASDFLVEAMAMHWQDEIECMFESEPFCDMPEDYIEALQEAIDEELEVLIKVGEREWK